MTDNHETTLIAEPEIRAALRQFRPNAVSFEAGVRERMELSNRAMDQFGIETESDMLRVAASVMPGSLLTLGKTSKLASSVGKTSAGTKLVGMLALPAITLVFAIGGAFVAMFLARKATVVGPPPRSDAEGMATIATYRWWERHKVVAIAVFAITLLAPLLGLTVPLLFVYGASGIAMVSLVTTLAREGLVTRTAICSSAIPGLAILAQAVNTIDSVSNTTHLLDQSALLAVLYAGVLILGFLMLPSVARKFMAGTRPANRSGVFVLVGLSLVPLGAAVFILTPRMVRSLWRPATEQTMQQYVENFDSAPYSSASWNQLEVPAKWLADSGVKVDWTKPRVLLETDLAGRSKAVLVSALRTGLLRRGDIDLAELEEAGKKLTRAVSTFYSTRAFSFVPEFEIRALALEGQLTDEMRDVLKTRLELKLQEIGVDDHNALIDSLELVELMDVIDRPADPEIHRERIHGILCELQQATGGGFQFAGGFASSKSLAHPNELSTAAAIELMEYFGVPEDVDVLAVRSYIRPRSSDFALPGRAAGKAAMRSRLDSLSDVRSLTWWDYLSCEQNLCLTILFTVLCVYCAAIAPSTSIPSVTVNQSVSD